MTPGRCRVVGQVANMTATGGCFELRVVPPHQHGDRSAFTDGEVAAKDFGALSAGTSAGQAAQEIVGHLITVPAP